MSFLVIALLVGLPSLPAVGAGAIAKNPAVTHVRDADGWTGYGTISTNITQVTTIATVPYVGCLKTGAEGVAFFGASIIDTGQPDLMGTVYAECLGGTLHGYGLYVGIPSMGGVFGPWAPLPSDQVNVTIFCIICTISNYQVNVTFSNLQSGQFWESGPYKLTGYPNAVACGTQMENGLFAGFGVTSPIPQPNFGTAYFDYCKATINGMPAPIYSFPNPMVITCYGMAGGPYAGKVLAAPLTIFRKMDFGVFYERPGP